jgi:hypothetical protein
MKIDIYKSTKSGYKYLSVPEGTDVTTLHLPASVDPDLLTLSPFKTSLELNPSQPRIALDQEDVIRQIKENGFAVHGAKIEITVGGA